MKKSLLLSTCSLALLWGNAAVADTNNMPTQEEMWQMIQAQQAQIEELKKVVASQNQKISASEEKITKNQAQVIDTKEKLALTEKKVSETVANVAKIEPAAGAHSGHGHSHGYTNGWWERTSLSHYGEIHYNSGNVDEIDIHRFIVGLHHEFNEDVRFSGEIEIEHGVAGEGENGEVEIEQAYVEFDLTEDDAHRAKAGLFLLPVGILNEVHEPTTFYGVERNQIETTILPTSWWAGGAALSGRIGDSGLSYDLAVHSGLKTPVTGANAYKIRNGRQKVSEAEATDPAYTARLKWTGYPGVELGVTGQYQTDITQNSQDGENVGATLFETHADIQKGGFGLRALYARWDIDGSGAEAIGRDEQYGWYIEPSYRFYVPFGYDDEGELGFYSRYSQYDNNAGSNNSSTEFERLDFGFNYWPVPNVVIKSDYSIVDGPTAAEDDNIFALGIGWAF